MGKIKYISEIRRFLKESPVVDINSLKKFIKKNNKEYIYLLINNLLKKKEIKQLTKGYYTIHEDQSLIVFCFKPSYLGLQNALSFHALWEQETNPVILTTKNTRKGIRKVFGRNIIIRKLNKKYFFGFDYYLDGDFYLPYSDIEKTLIDMLYFKQPIDNEIINNFKKKLNKTKLKTYLKNYPKKFQKRVLKVLNNKSAKKN